MLTLISLTSNQYSSEAYDYPRNINETFGDLGRTVSEKVQLLSSATSPAEAQAALTAPPAAKPQPKTFAHAIARASLASSQTLHQQHTGTGEDPLATALEKFALAEERVGEARLAQDAQIQSRFLAGWNTTLNTNIMFATRARKGVEKSRLTLDAAKAKAKGGVWKLPVPAVAAAQQSPREGAHEEEISPEAQEEIEKAEDEFVTQTEEAVGVMKNVSLGTDDELQTNESITDHEHRSLIPLSHSATSPSLSQLRWSSTRRPTKSSASLRPPLRDCRLSRRQVAPQLIHCLEKPTQKLTSDGHEIGPVPKEP